MVEGAALETVLNGGHLLRLKSFIYKGCEIRFFRNIDFSLAFFSPFSKI